MWKDIVDRQRGIVNFTDEIDRGDGEDPRPRGGRRRKRCRP